MDLQIRFCTAADGTRIGFGTVGSGPPLLIVYSWGCNIESDWDNPTCRAGIERLAEGGRVIGLMRRGFGSSQREVDDLSLDAQASDIRAVADALSLDNFDLCAFQDGIGPAVAFVLQDSGRVARLILWDAFTRGEEVIDPRAGQNIIELVRANWGLATRMFADLALPNGPAEEKRWLARSMRQSISPEMSARYLQFLFTLDLTADLPRIQVPTLVLHRRGDRTTPLSAGRAAAAMIPDARFALLEGDIAYAWLGDLSYMDKVSEFRREGRPGAERAPAASSPFRTVLFTDLAGHTAMMHRLGDEKGREVLREHERITRETLAAFGGAEVKAMGDGFLASFGSAQRALECAIGLQRAFEAAGVLAGHEAVRLHIGVNAGEPIAEEDDLFGSSVILAARVASKAEGGQVLVTNVVRELVAGKGFAFTDRGEVEMKGFEEAVRLYEVRWEAAHGQAPSV